MVTNDSTAVSDWRWSFSQSFHHAEPGRREARWPASPEAYVYGYPLVYDLREVAESVEGGGSLPIQAPYNSFAHARRLLGPETRFVSPNNDTLYVVGPCDMRQGPLVLHVPDTADRYYVLQFVDAWTNNIAYLGRRATGTAEAEYLPVRQQSGPPRPGAPSMCPSGRSPTASGVREPGGRGPGQAVGQPWL